MSGIVAVYGLVVSVLIAGDIAPPPGKSYALFEGFLHLACGLSVGLAGLGAGYAIGIVGDSVCSSKFPTYVIDTDNDREFVLTCNNHEYSWGCC